MAEARVLVIDDDPLELERCTSALKALPNLHVEKIARSTDALRRLGEGDVDLVVTDLRMPVLDGIDLLRVARSQDPDLPVLLLTGYPSVDTALAALKEGAADYLTKPVHEGELAAVVERLLGERRLRRENRLLERHLTRDDERADLVGASPAMVRVLDLLRRLAASDLDVLVVGETGTGKELVARRLHALSVQARGRFVPVDCGAIPEHLLESELFGHEKGAFTGADRQSMGLFEYADGGTVFLDEVQSLPLHLQAKLLRTLQERTYRRVGATQEQKLRIRIVAAVNEDPEDLVGSGRMRQDLYHRLDVGRIELPPLRDRSGDVRLLALHFLRRYAQGGGGAGRDISEEALAALERHSWPGNVRELQNVIRRGLALAPGPVFTTRDLPPDLAHALEVGDLGGAGGFHAVRDARIAAFERDYLSAALRGTFGDVSKAADAAGVSRATFYRLLKKHGVDPDRFRSG